MRTVRAAVARCLIAAGCVAAAVGLPVTAPAGAAAQAQILGADTPTAIDGSYVVVYKDSAATEARSASAALGSRVTSTYTTLFPGFAASMGEQEAKRFAADPDVLFVQQNQRVGIAGDQPWPPSWGLDRIDQRDRPLDRNYSYPSTASNVHAYVIDTGVDLDNPEFGGRATSGFDFIDDGPADDEHGHGSHVAGTLGGEGFGVAKGVRLVSIRVLDEHGWGTSAGVADGVFWASDNAIKPAVVNMSLGIATVDYVINYTVQQSILEHGLPYVVAAGNNSGDSCDFSPAAVPEAITVSASTESDTRAWFSNHGTCTDLFAPGENINSTGPWGGTIPNSGTSMAAPHVAGAAALYLSAFPTLTPGRVAAALSAGATPGRIVDPGAGSPNLLLHMGPELYVPPPGGGPCAAVSNFTDYAITDFSTVTSPVTVSGCANGVPESFVHVSIKHTYIGDLVIDLIGPSGSIYNLRYRSGGGAADLNQTYMVNLTGETADGAWILRVKDEAGSDTGYLDSWTLDL